MPFQVEVKTNFADHELTIEDCNMIINDLQLMYKSVKNQIYSAYFNNKKLTRYLIYVGILFLLYLYTEEIAFIYTMPLLFLTTIIIGLIASEFASKKIKQQINIQINHFKELKQKLKKETLSS